MQPRQMTTLVITSRERGKRGWRERKEREEREEGERERERERERESREEEEKESEKEVSRHSRRVYQVAHGASGQPMQQRLH